LRHCQPAKSEVAEGGNFVFINAGRTRFDGFNTVACQRGHGVSLGERSETVKVISFDPAHMAKASAVFGSGISPRRSRQTVVGLIPSSRAAWRTPFGRLAMMVEYCITHPPCVEVGEGGVAYSIAG
jgi:hypothetical protein